MIIEYTPLFDHLERTAFSDEFYGAIGRALYISQRFESNLRVFLALLDLKGGKNNNDLQPEEIIIRSWKKSIMGNITRLIEKDYISLDAHDLLDDARVARNKIAHEITVGVINEIESDKGRDNIIDELRVNIQAIAKGDAAICLLIQYFTNEPIPKKRYMDEYPDKIVHWVCDLYDE